LEQFSGPDLFSTHGRYLHAVQKFHRQDGWRGESHSASGCEVWAQAQHVDNIHNLHFTRMLTISQPLCTCATRANSRFASALSGGSPGGKTIPVL